MLFSKLCQKTALVTSFKTSSRNQTSKFSSFKILVKKRISGSHILLASAALGVSVYTFASLRVTVCESLDKKDLSLNFSVADYDNAICKSRDLLQRLKDEAGIPGIVVGVSINGETVWAEGLGYADVENRVLCSKDTVMRIASISKSITMAAVAKLWELEKLDLDKPVQDYVPDFPLKSFDGKQVTITCRHLVSHLGGIRHYDKSANNLSSKKEKDTQVKAKSEFDEKEYYITDHFKDVKSSLNIFKDDPLIANPGSRFYYSTHAWTLVSAIVEAAAKEEFSTHMTKLFKALGMSNTYLDVNDVLIYHRSRNYIKGKKGELLNAPFVDNSYKWAGGGFLSTVGDLLRFGNAMLYSLQFTDACSQKEQKLNEKMLNTDHKNVLISSSKLTGINTIPDNCLPGYLKRKTVEALWMPVTDAKQAKYGMGWFVGPESNECMFCERKKFSVYHTGGAVGASSILLIVPEIKHKKQNILYQNHAPKGIIVVILTNMHSVENLSRTASNIAQFFDNS